MKSIANVVREKAEEIAVMAISSVLDVPDDLDDPAWDRYFGCLDLTVKGGMNLPNARQHCKKHRPDYEGD